MKNIIKNNITNLSKVELLPIELIINLRKTLLDKNPSTDSELQLNKLNELKLSKFDEIMSYLS